MKDHRPQTADYRLKTTDYRLLHLLVFSLWSCVFGLIVMGMKCNKSNPLKGDELEGDTLSTVDYLAAEIEDKRKELRELGSFIRAKKDSLARREAKLKARELALGKLREKIDLTLKGNKNKLARAYELMEPEKVVSIMDSLSDEIVLKLLLSMRERNSARILEVLPRERAARITENFMKAKNE